jgi:hypothetical protein
MYSRKTRGLQVSVGHASFAFVSKIMGGVYAICTLVTVFWMFADAPVYRYCIGFSADFINSVLYLEGFW